MPQITIGDPRFRDFIDVGAMSADCLPQQLALARWELWQSLYQHTMANTAYPECAELSYHGKFGSGHARHAPE